MGALNHSGVYVLWFIPRWWSLSCHILKCSGASWRDSMMTPDIQIIGCAKHVESSLIYPRTEIMCRSMLSIKHSRVVFNAWSRWCLHLGLFLKSSIISSKVARWVRMCLYLGCLAASDTSHLVSKSWHCKLLAGCPQCWQASWKMFHARLQQCFLRWDSGRSSIVFEQCCGWFGRNSCGQQ